MTFELNKILTPNEIKTYDSNFKEVKNKVGYEFNVLSVGLRGSIIFGADIETSDKDVSLIVLPTLENIIMYGKGLTDGAYSGKNEVDISLTTLQSLTHSFLLGDFNILGFIGTDLRVNTSDFFENYVLELTSRYKSKFMLKSCEGNLNQLDKLYEKKLLEPTKDIPKLAKIVTHQLFTLNLFIKMFSTGEIKPYQEEYVQMYKKLRKTTDLTTVKNHKKMVEEKRVLLEKLVKESNLPDRIEQKEAMKFYASKVLEYYNK